MASNFTWSETKLYNKDGVQIFIVRANEDNRVRIFKIRENGETCPNGVKNSTLRGLNKAHVFPCCRFSVLKCRSLPLYHSKVIIVKFVKFNVKIVKLGVRTSNFIKS